MSIQIRTETPLSDDAQTLIAESDRVLQSTFQPGECFTLCAEELATPNTQFLVARLNGQAIGCVALVDQGSYGEVKRLLVRPEARGLGVASLLMEELEYAARDIGLSLIRLETGHALEAATAFYHSIGFQDCDAFGSYPGSSASLFMEKQVGVVLNLPRGKKSAPA